MPFKPPAGVNPDALACQQMSKQNGAWGGGGCEQIPKKDPVTKETTFTCQCEMISTTTMMSA